MAKTAITSDKLKVKVFADGADKAAMLEMYKNPLVRGFTTNPTLMHKAGVTDYQAFAKELIKAIPDRHLSFEVFSDDIAEMEQQANLIKTWGKNVYVKIPVSNTKGETTYAMIRRLSEAGTQVNLTALFTNDQVTKAVAALGGLAPACISVFAGRIADAGIDPVPMMQKMLAEMAPHKNLEMIWASPREPYNVMQAHDIGCHIITATNDIIKKLSNFGKDLDEASLETVQVFRKDAIAAGFKLAV
jgi:transaldolase